MSPRRITAQTLLGAIIVLVGLGLLARSTGLFDVGSLFRFVPSLFILLGVYALVSSGFRNLVGPLLVVLVATAWQLVALDVLAARDVLQFWPVLVILLGVSLVLSQRRARARSQDSDAVSAFAFFGGADRRVTSAEFRNADLTAVFGGVELDLRDAAIADPPAHVSTTSIFGGTELRVPREWNVRIDVLPLFGASEDSRPRSEAEHETVDLVVTGFVAFGGLEILD
ncbi:LiaF domain-containing protein [Halomicroarcula sp. GCM10025709]|uniref:LiaF transmembrane domain-containing protein n=1 Tax=Haloarcula TaxID=2237 RepID=UPI0024C2BC91|nr:LiaF domain-containing protein [Halomicroarcula sp. YJ-61-S]